MEAVTQQIRNYLQFIALNFIEHPDQAELRVAEVDDRHLSFRLIVAQEDIAQLIGRNEDAGKNARARKMHFRGFFALISVLKQRFKKSLS